MKRSGRVRTRRPAHHRAEDVIEDADGLHCSFLGIDKAGFMASSLYAIGLANFK
jgi:hypothetical protein